VLPQLSAKKPDKFARRGGGTLRQAPKARSAAGSCARDRPGHGAATAAIRDPSIGEATGAHRPWSDAELGEERAGFANKVSVVIAISRSRSGALCLTAPRALVSPLVK